MKDAMTRLLLLLLMLTIFSPVMDAFARRSSLASEQKAQLANIQKIYLDVRTLTESGPISPTEIAEVVASRFEEVGYKVVNDFTQPHYVEFLVKCEEKKRWIGTTEHGGDADLPDTPALLWNGPAC